MSARRVKASRPSGGSLGERRLRDEIAADVLELWIGVSRLMSRLGEPCADRKAGRRLLRRRLSGRSDS